MTSFDHYAAYYDLFYQNKDYAAEVAFVRSLAEAAGPGLGNAVLDLGCGTGRHAILMAEHSLKVMGFDLSESMITRARQRVASADRSLASRVSFHVGDLRNLRLEDRFDSVVSLFHVLSYQVTDTDQDAFFEAARSRLSPSGLLIFDFWYGPAVLTDPPRQVTRSVEGDGVRVIRRTSSTLQCEQNRVDVRFDIEVTEVASGNHRSFVEDHAMRFLFLPEIERRLHTYGFRLVAARKWLSDEAPDVTSWNACVVAAVD